MSRYIHTCTCIYPSRHREIHKNSDLCFTRRMIDWYILSARVRELGRCGRVSSGQTKNKNARSRETEQEGGGEVGAKHSICMQNLFK